VDGDCLSRAAHAQRQRSGVRGLAQWIKANLGADVPLHFYAVSSRVFVEEPAHPPVPTLERAKAIADAEGLHYVYIGMCRPSRAKHLLPQVPQDVSRARGIYGQRHIDPQEQLPILPGADCRHLARMM